MEGVATLARARDAHARGGGRRCRVSFQVTAQEGQDMGRNYGCPNMETSAKTRVNVEESFYQLVREIRKHRDNAPKAAKGGGKKKPLLDLKKCAIL